jgi:hypothetical protein
MTKRADVLLAVQALAALALPGAKIMGMNGDDDLPSKVPAEGLCIVRSGDPGEPEVTCSPRMYWYRHRIPVDLASYPQGAETAEEAIDRMAGELGAAVALNRHLGGLCDWLEASAPLTGDFKVDGGVKPPRAASIIIEASYGTPDPLA